MYEYDKNWLDTDDSSLANYDATDDGFCGVQICYRNDIYDRNHSGLILTNLLGFLKLSVTKISLLF